MKMNLKKYFILGAVSILLSSCLAKREIVYMKDIENVALENSIKNSRATLQPGDKLIITVSGKDLDVVKPFNQNYSSATTTTQYSVPSSNSQIQPVPVSGPTYIIDTEGDIDFPQIGKISTKNENLENFKIKLADRLSAYIKDPIVDAKLTNFTVEVLGEVNKPGTYLLPDGNGTLIQALGLAGDLTPYGIRTNVLVLRNVDGKITTNRIDLTSAEFINSPYYYLRQNDMIYIQPNANREKATRVDPNTGLYISIASVVASLAIGIIALVK